VPAQSSPSKQRIGVYLWLGMLVVIFSLLIKLFKMKNGGEYDILLRAGLTRRRLSVPAAVLVKRKKEKLDIEMQRCRL
jgi:hypothetical protein